MVGSSEAPRVSRIILREQLDPSSAYDIIFTRIMSRIINSVAAFLIIIQQDISPRTAKLRAMAITGQIMAFRVARETVVRSVGMKGYSAKETEEIRRIVLEHSRAVLEDD